MGSLSFMPAAEVPRVEVSLRTLLVVFRVTGVIWLIALSLGVLLTEDPIIDPRRRLRVMVTVMVVAVAWTLLTLVAVRIRPAVFSRWSFNALDLAVALAIALTPQLTRSETFFVGGFPISAAFFAANAHGLFGGLVAGALVAVASTIGTSYADARTYEVLAINVLAPLVVAWGFGMIRRNDLRAREAEEALEKERAARIRLDERAELAARIHDSVLQTLAIIQHRSTEPKEVVRLARHQERELRSWLMGSPQLRADSLHAALLATAGEIESDHGVRMEVSTVGDRPLDQAAEALVMASREAMVNAARHSGVDRVFILAETDAAGARVVVKDRGVGFDLASVPADRRGISESIVGRLERAGGKASVRATAGDGVEVDMWIPT